MAIAPEVKKKTNATAGEGRGKKRRKQPCLLREFVGVFVGVTRPCVDG